MVGRIILITGANRGIGFSIAEALGRRSPDDVLLIGSRSIGNAAEAIKELRGEKSISAKLYPLQLDVTRDSDIDAASAWVKKEFGRLDVLINNAGFARRHEEGDRDDLRASYRQTFEVNVTSIACTIAAFESLLRASEMPRVISISSSRGSMALNAGGSLPPTSVIAYSISKSCLNALHLQFVATENSRGAGVSGSPINYYLACPGHCKTAFNGFKGLKDPLLGARVVEELTLATKSQYESGFWEYSGVRGVADSEEKMRQVPW